MIEKHDFFDLFYRHSDCVSCSFLLVYYIFSHLEIKNEQSDLQSGKNLTIAII